MCWYYTAFFLPYGPNKVIIWVLSGASDVYIWGVPILNRWLTMSGEDLLKMTVEELDRLISANTIVGEKIETEDKIIIPVAGFGFAFGAGIGSGGGKGKDGETSGEGAGAGGGGGVHPTAIIIVYKNVPGPEGVEVLSLKRKGAIAEVVETIGESMLPPIVEALKSKGKEAPAEESGEEPAT
jgi:uncharacterized spore protein YtfJ